MSQSNFGIFVEEKSQLELWIQLVVKNPSSFRDECSEAGLSFRFKIDTGAQTSCITPQTIRQLDLELDRTDTDYIVHGQPRPSYIIQFVLCGQEFSSVAVGDHHTNLLGMDVLKNLWFRLPKYGPDNNNRPEISNQAFNQ